MFRPVKYLFTFVFLGSVACAHAQYRHQIGINGTQFFKQFIAQNNSTLVENNPYLLTYRLHTKLVNYRLGLGGEYSFLNEDNSINQFTQETNTRNLAIRVGADLTKQLSKHWFVYYGLDVFSIRKNKEIKTFPSGGQFVQKTVVTQESKTAGVAGVLTLEFRINDKITLFTEANLNWGRSSTSDKVENPDFPDSSTHVKTTSGNMSYLTPLSLFFSILI